MNSYQLTRKWFDFVSDNSDKVRPQHLAVYMLAIEHCNRLGWPKEFSFPSSYAMNYTGIATYKTYIKALKELSDFGFIRMIKKARNQFSANIIALVDFTQEGAKSSTKAMDRAIFSAVSEQGIEQNQSKTEALPKQLPEQAHSSIKAITKAELIKGIRAYLKETTPENRITFIDEVLKQEDFQDYLWQNFERFRVPNHHSQTDTKTETAHRPQSQSKDKLSFEQCKTVFKKTVPSYVWEGADSKHLKALLQKIQSSIKQIENASSVEETFKFLLDNLPDWWRTKKFTLANLNKNYNEIINEIQQSNGKHQSNTTQELDEYAQNFGK